MFKSYIRYQSVNDEETFNAYVHCLIDNTMKPMDMMTKGDTI